MTLFCPNCGYPFSTMIMAPKLTDTKLFCDRCKQEFSVKEILFEKKCKCGKNFHQIKSRKKLFCETCYVTFFEELKPFFSTENLDPVYAAEKVYFRNYLLEIRKNRLAKSRWELLLEQYKYPVLTGSENCVEDISQLPLPESKENISVRFRYTRNIKNILYDLPEEEKISLGAILLHEHSFLRKNLRELAFFQEGKLEEKCGVLTATYRGRTLRFYTCDEDHFRMDMHFFLDSRVHEDSIMRLIGETVMFYKLGKFIDNLLYWQVDPDLGFLTKCPTNSGSGMRVYFRIPVKNRKTALLHYFQTYGFFKKLRHFTIRGDRGEKSEIKDFIIAGWDLPYLDEENLKKDFEETLYRWYREVLFFPAL